MSVFQRNSNAFAVRYYPRSIVCSRTVGRHHRAVNVAPRSTGQLANALHLLPHVSAACDVVGIKLYHHSFGVQVIEIHLHLKYVLDRICLHLHVTKAQRDPFLFQSMFPINYALAHCTFIVSSLTVGSCSREVVLLSVFTHRSVNGESGGQTCHAFTHSLDPSGWNAAFVSGIKFRDYLTFQQIVERVGFDSIPSGIVAMHLPSPNAHPISGV